MFNSEKKNDLEENLQNINALFNVRVAVFANASAVILFPFYMNALSIDFAHFSDELLKIITLFLLGLIFGIIANIQLFFSLLVKNSTIKMKKAIWLILFSMSMILFIMGSWKSVQVMLSHQQKSATQAISYNTPNHTNIERLVEVEFTISGYGHEPIHFAVLR